MNKKDQKNITVLSVILINILAILGLRWLTFAGKFGAASVFIWIVAAFLFFIPASFICAEFGAAHPDKEGAITDWVKAELGETCAFFAAWFYFFTQLLFIPTMLTFTGIGVGYAIDPQLAHNKLFITTFAIVMFWAMLFFTTKSLEIFKKTTEIVCLLGTLLPIILLVIAALISIFFLKQKIPTDFSLSNWIPKINLTNILFLVGVSAALGGSEVSAPFVTRMKNPQRNFPFAIICATIIIIICYILGTLSLVVVISPADFNTSSGVFAVIKMVFSEIHTSFLADIVFILMSISMLVGGMLWLASSAKMLIDGNDQKIFPKLMLKRTPDGLPINTMIFQGIFVTLIMVLNDYFSTVNTIYNVLVMAASVLLFLSYIFMFIAFLKMKFTRKTKCVFEVPGKKIGAIVAFSLATVTCLASIIIPMISIPEGANIFVYELEIIGIPIIFAFSGFLLYRRKNKIKKEKRIEIKSDQTSVKNGRFSKNTRAIIIAIIFLFCFVEAFSTDCFVPALPAIANHFKIQIGFAQLIIPVYFSGYIVLIFYGFLSDHYGRRKILLTSCSIFIIGSMLCVFSDTYILFLLGRFLQGAGICTVSMSRVLFCDIYTQEQLKSIYSVLRGLLILVGSVAPLVGGYLKHYFGWQSIFIGIFCLGIGLFLFILLLYPETLQKDLNSQVSFSAFVLKIKALFKNTSFLIAVLWSTLCYSAIYIILAITPFFFQNIVGWSTIKYGYFAFGVPVAMACGTMINNVVVKKISSFAIISYAMGTGIIFSLILIVNSFFIENVTIVVLLLLGYSVLCGIVAPNAFLYAIKHINKDYDAGISFTTFSFIRMLGVSLIVFCVSFLHSQSAIIMGILLLFLSVVAILFSITKTLKQRYL